MGISRIDRFVPVMLLVCLAWTGTASAQLQVASIRGTIVDGTSGPVANAVIALRDPQGVTLLEARTDATGGFTFADVPLGASVLVVTTPSGRGLTRALVIQSTVPVEIAIDVSSTVTEQVVVHGDAASVTATRPWSVAGSVVRDALPSLPSQRVQTALAALPGWTSEDNGLLHVRGVDDGLLYVVDGVPVYERLDRLFGLAPTPASVVSLNVINGYVPPEFGFKSGAVVQVRSVSGLDTPLTGTFDAGAGAHASRHVEGVVAGAIRPSLAFMAHGSGEHSARFLDPVHPDNLHNAGWSSSSGGQLTHRARTRVLTIGIQAARSRYEVPNNAQQHEAGQDAHQRTSQLSGTVSWQQAVGTRTAWQASAYRRSATSLLEPSQDDIPVSAGGERRNVRLGALWSLTHQRERHSFKVGAEVSRLRLAESFRFTVTDRSAGDELGLSDEALEHDATNPFALTSSATPTLLSAFVQDSFQPTDRLSIDYGIRVDHSRLLLARSQMSPRAGLAYQVGSRTVVRASIVRLFQPPQVEYLLLASSEAARRLSPFAAGTNSGGADLEPERQTSIEASLSHDLGAHARVDGAVWLRRGTSVDDPNVFLGTTVTFPNSVARQRAAGVDLRVDLLPTHGLSASAVYSHARITQTGPITGGLFLEDDYLDITDGTEFTPDHDVRHAWSLQASYAPPTSRWRVGAHARHRGGTPLEVDDDRVDDLVNRDGGITADPETGRTRPYLVIDLQGDWTARRGPRSSVIISTWIENLTDRFYAYNFGNPFSGTHFGARRRAGAAIRLTF